MHSEDITLEKRVIWNISSFFIHGIFNQPFKAIFCIIFIHEYTFSINYQGKCRIIHNLIIIICYVKVKCALWNTCTTACPAHIPTDESSRTTKYTTFVVKYDTSQIASKSCLNAYENSFTQITLLYRKMLPCN